MKLRSSGHPYRPLTSDEVDTLVRQGCTADAWSDILVAPAFRPEGIVRSSFYGPARLGAGVTMRDARCHAHGTAISVLSETGARPVLAHPGLSPLSVYVQAFHAYGGQDCLAERLRRLAQPIACPLVIDDGAYIDQATLRNCYVGPHVRLEDGITAEECIFLHGTHLAKGEACALLAGPYTVSHHKSTLLIAAATSFFNAGSGSNQSNHSYKLGPNKFGILERGVKLGSSSYLFWPARVGAFTTVLGRHKTHFDLRDLPFSYAVGEEERTVVIPAVSLQSIGTLRDELKWQQRDAATASLLTLRTLTPYTAQRIQAGIRLLEALKDSEPTTLTTALGVHHKYYRHGECFIPTRSIQKGIDLYREALAIYGIGQLCDRIARGLSLGAGDAGTGPWLDYLGFILPQHETEQTCLGALSSIDDPTAPTHADALADLDEAVARCIRQQEEWEWNWTSRMIADQFGFRPDRADAATLAEAIDRYRFAVRHRRLLLHFDIDKEFNQEAAMLYGIDGTPDDARCDFEAAMGREEDNDTFCRLLQLTDEALALADRAQQALATAPATLHTEN